MNTIPRDLRTEDFDFHLPENRIAQQAVQPRDHARLLHVKPGSLSDHHVYDLPNILRHDDVLVVNDTKVIPARLYGKRGEIKVEILLHKKNADAKAGIAPTAPAAAGTPQVAADAN
jgi:S-adenosylmethionine:tRNA ribosyltransferase-isomerase